MGEEQKKLTAQALSLLVLREEPDMLARTVLTNKGNSFQLTSLAIQLANVTQFVDSQVGTRIIELHNTLLHLNIAPPLMLRKGALNTPVSK